MYSPIDYAPLSTDTLNCLHLELVPLFRQYLASQAAHTHTTTLLLIEPSLGQLLELSHAWLNTPGHSTLQLVIVRSQAFNPQQLHSLSLAPNTAAQLRMPTLYALPGCQRHRTHSRVLWDNWHGNINAVLAELHPLQYVALAIIYNQQHYATTVRQWHYGTPFSAPALCSKPATPSSIAIIGAGIAGLSVADACHQRHITTHMYELHHPLAGASGNPSALLVPRPVKIPLYANTLHHLGARYSIAWLGLRHSAAIGHTPAIWLLSGVQQGDAAKTAGYPPGYYCTIAPSEIARIGGYATQCNGLLLSAAATVNPQVLANAICTHPLNHMHHTRVSRITNHNGVGLYAQNGLQQTNLLQQHSHVVVCSNINTPELCIGLSEFKFVRGQVSLAQASSINPPTVPYVYGGYICNSGNSTLLGASFVRDDRQTDVRSSEHQHNLGLWNACLSAPVQVNNTQWAGRASIRSQVRDYYPVLGRTPTLANVSVLSALGAKGFAYAPICAEHLIGAMLGEVSPLTRTLAQACDSTRILNPW